jgi:SAM-dependent methyltransferase
LKEYASCLKIIDDLRVIEKESFDYLFLFDVVEHVEDDISMLKDVTKRLRRGGTLLISVPAHKKAFGRSDELMGHFRRYEKQELCTLLKRSDYSEITILSYGFPLVNFTLRVINFLYRFSRESNARDYETLSINERTQKSGIKSPDIVHRLLFPFNRFTMVPFIFLQRLFLKKDWGVAYIAYAKKA